MGPRHRRGGRPGDLDGRAAEAHLRGRRRRRSCARLGRHGPEPRRPGVARGNSELHGRPGRRRPRRRPRPRRACARPGPHGRVPGDPVQRRSSRAIRAPSPSGAPSASRCWPPSRRRSTTRPTAWSGSTSCIARSRASDRGSVGGWPFGRSSVGHLAFRRQDVVVRP